MKLSENFYRHEFACRDADGSPCACGLDTVDAQLVEILQALRDFFERPVRITSACRCLRQNRRVGGASNSQHLYGRAADVVVEGIDPKLVQEWARDNDVPGIGCYNTFTHLDTRSGPSARW